MMQNNCLFSLLINQETKELKDSFSTKLMMMMMMMIINLRNFRIKAVTMTAAISNRATRKQVMRNKKQLKKYLNHEKSIIINLFKYNNIVYKINCSNVNQNNQVLNKNSVLLHAYIELIQTGRLLKEKIICKRIQLKFKILNII